MSGIIHKLNHFIKDLKRFAFPIPTPNPNEHLHDQFLYRALKKRLKDLVQDKVDDFDIPYDGLAGLQMSCEHSFYNEALKKIRQEISAYCYEVLEDRQLLLQNLLDFIHNIRVITDVAFINTSKINAKISPICKKLFKVHEHCKMEDYISFIRATDTKLLYATIDGSGVFSHEQFLAQLKKQEQNYQNKLTELETARKSIVSKQKVANAFRPSLIEKFAALSLQPSSAMVPASAPTSPVKMGIEPPMARSRSLPTYEKAQRATARYLDQAHELKYPPMHIERKKSSSGSVFGLPQPLNTRNAGASTSSTLIDQSSDQPPKSFFVAYGVSSRSEDESDEKKMKESAKHQKRSIKKQ